MRHLLASPLAALLPPETVDVDLTCSGCGRCSTVPAIVAVDWRNLGALQEALETCSDLACPRCGSLVERSHPLLVVRPGDPIPLIGAFPTAGELEVQAEQLAGLLRGEVAASVGGPAVGFVPIGAGDLAEIAGRYLGFDLVGWPGDLSPTAASWVRSVPSTVDLPDPMGALNRFVTSVSAAAGDGVIDSEPVLVERAWAPVVDRLADQLVGAQPDGETVEIVRGRLGRIEQRRLLGATADNQAAADPAARRALHDLELPAPGRDRRRLDAVVDTLATTPDNVLYAAGLVSQTAARLRDPMRSRQDLDVAVETARRAVGVALNIFGDANGVTLTTKVNLAVALNDRGDAESVAEGESLLIAALQLAVESESPLLVDVVLNLGAIVSHRPGSRTDAQEGALALFEEAEHLARLLAPGDPDKAVSAIANQAAVYRSRIIGDPGANILQAVERYDRALALARDQDTPPVERLLLRVNRTNAQFSLLQHLPEQVDRDDLAAELLASAEDLQQRLAPDHPVRLTHLANISATLGDLYSDSVRAGRPRVELLAGALELSDLAVADHVAVYGPVHRATARVLNNKAANLARPRSDATGLFDADSAIAIGNELLGWVTEDEMADLRASVASNLGRVHVARDDWSQAAAALAVAVASHQALYMAAASRPARFGERVAAGQAVHRLAFSQVRTNQVSAAVSTIERAREHFGTSLTAASPARPEPSGPGAAIVYCGVCSYGTYVVIRRPGAQPTGLLTDLRIDHLAAPLVARQLDGTTF